MKCPVCRSEDCRVVDTRQRVDRRQRKRVCGACGENFFTTEVHGLVRGGQLPHLTPMVQKKSGKIVPFERDKLMQSLSVAVRKSRRADVPINDLVAQIEQEVTAGLGEAVSTVAIGGMAIAALRAHDRMAYVRYLSVHQEMESEGDIRALIEELQKLLPDNAAADATSDGQEGGGGGAGGAGGAGGGESAD